MVVYAEYYFAKEKDIFGFVYKKYKTEEREGPFRNENFPNQKDHFSDCAD